MQRLGRLDEAHLQAAALHFLLDSADRRMESLGTWAAEADAERFLSECVDWVEDRLRRQALSYFFGEGLGEAYTLVGYMRLLSRSTGRRSFSASNTSCWRGGARVHSSSAPAPSRSCSPSSAGSAARSVSSTWRVRIRETSASSFCSGRDLQPTEEG